MCSSDLRNGGVVQINFGSSFITAAALEYSEARMAAGKAYKEAHPEVTESFLWREFPGIYAAEHGPLPYASVDDVIDHIDHVVRLAGIDHVGIGSDFDGVGECEAMTGVLVMSMIRQNASSETWLTSIMMPSRFISRITSAPNSLMPSHCVVLS